MVNNLKINNNTKFKYPLPRVEMEVVIMILIGSAPFWLIGSTFLIVTIIERNADKKEAILYRYDQWKNENYDLIRGLGWKSNENKYCSHETVEKDLKTIIKNCKDEKLIQASIDLFNQFTSIYSQYLRIDDSIGSRGNDELKSKSTELLARSKEMQKQMEEVASYSLLASTLNSDNSFDEGDTAAVDRASAYIVGIKDLESLPTS